MKEKSERRTEQESRRAERARKQEKEQKRFRKSTVRASLSASLFVDFVCDDQELSVFGGDISLPRNCLLTAHKKFEYCLVQVELKHSIEPRGLTC